MHTPKFVLGLAAALTLGVAYTFAGPAAKTYQVTGPVVELDDKKIVVDKDGENYEIARDQDTKLTGEPKVGAKVTIKYRMYATTVEVKDGAAKGEAKKTEEKKAE